MGLSKNSKGGRARPAMNVTPLVDIVLVLLIIFMVVLPNSDPGASVELPTIEHGEDDPEGEEPFTLSIGRDGRLFFEAERLDDDRFHAVLDAAHASAPDKKIILRADRQVPYGRVRTLFKIAQEIGFPGVMLRTNANPDQAPEAEALAAR
ncbi:MAG: biopolymer transporter ExbD [Sandaracinus sp.]|nr:biopolymer transporter ExbD [Sandaracinus sp.]MCB9613227.1 biopolymer transporter ExbD [Sandaracinus sp.]